jgi:hypothetical protein
LIIGYLQYQVIVQQHNWKKNIYGIE